MQVFAIFDVSDPDRIRSRLQTRFNADHYDCGSTTFFVATADMTTQQIAEAVGLGSVDQGSRGVVTLVTAFWGYHDSALWEWIRIKHQANVH